MVNTAIPKSVNSEKTAFYYCQLSFSRFAVESLQGVIDFLLGELGKEWIVTSIHPKNIKSIRLVKRLGFKRETQPDKFLDADEMERGDLAYVLCAKA